MRFYWMNSLGDEGKINTKNTIDNIVKAIHEAWNYEADLFKKENDELVFAPYETNEFNSELLEQYGLRLIDTEKYRRFQNIKTGEIYKASWESE